MRALASPAAQNPGPWGCPAASPAGLGTGSVARLGSAGLGWMAWSRSHIGLVSARVAVCRTAGWRAPGAAAHRSPLPRSGGQNLGFRVTHVTASVRTIASRQRTCAYSRGGSGSSGGAAQKYFSAARLSLRRGGNCTRPAASSAGRHSRGSGPRRWRGARAQFDLTRSSLLPNVSSCPERTGRRAGGTNEGDQRNPHPALVNLATGCVSERYAGGTERSEPD
jgi:hypothetical protein